MPLLSNCCFFFDLKVGTKIIGILSLIGALLNCLSMAVLLVMIMFMNVGAKTVDHFANLVPPPSDYEEDDYQDVRQEVKNILEIFMEHIEAVQVILYILLAICLLGVVTSSMLIHGVKRNRRGLLIPYMIQEIINILALLGVLIWILVVFGTDVQIVSGVIGMAVAALIHMYFVLVVLSQYQALQLIRMQEEMSMK